jgi:hypothetical protein
MILRRAQANGAVACAFALAAVFPYVRERIAAGDATAGMMMPEMGMPHASLGSLAWGFVVLAISTAVTCVLVVRHGGGFARVSPRTVGLLGAALVAGTLAGFDLCESGIMESGLLGFVGCHCWLTGLLGAVAGLVALGVASEARALLRACAAYLAALVATLIAFVVASPCVAAHAFATVSLRVPSPHVRRSKGRAPPRSIA